MEFFNNKGCYEVKISCPKGSIVLWDGRTIHYGAEPMSTRRQPNVRCVTYVSYLPRSLASEEELAIKRKLFDEMYTTGHDAIRSRPSAKTQWYDVSEYEYKIPKPKLTDLGMKLAGF